jgi:very-short-patch-repair endonuclease
VAEIAARQRGVISAAQLGALGLTKEAIHRRARAGRLHRVYPAVYAVGHPRLEARGRLWAAVLYGGGPLSHRSAASLWDLMRPPAAYVEITAPKRIRSVSGIRGHRSGTLDARDVTRLDGLPVTTVSRTLIDLADVVSEQQLERVCHRAEHLRALDAASLSPPLGRRSRALRAALAGLALAEPAVTRSELEEAMLSLVARHDLPAPRVNAPVLGYVADFLWPERRLIAETDGRRTHLTPTSFEQDRERDARLTVAGYRVVRFTWRQLVERPRYVAATLRSLLAF